MAVTFRKDKHGIFIIADTRLYRPTVPDRLVQSGDVLYKSVKTKFKLGSEANARTIGNTEFCKVTYQGSMEVWFAHSSTKTGRFNRHWQYLVKHSEDFFNGLNPVEEAPA